MDSISIESNANPLTLIVLDSNLTTSKGKKVMATPPDWALWYFAIGYAVIWIYLIVQVYLFLQFGLFSLAALADIFFVGFSSLYLFDGIYNSC